MGFLYALLQTLDYNKLVDSRQVHNVPPRYLCWHDSETRPRCPSPHALACRIQTCRDQRHRKRRAKTRWIHREGIAPAGGQCGRAASTEKVVISEHESSRQHACSVTQRDQNPSCHVLAGCFPCFPRQAALRDMTMHSSHACIGGTQALQSQNQCGTTRASLRHADSTETVIISRDVNLQWIAHMGGCRHDGNHERVHSATPLDRTHWSRGLQLLGRSVTRQTRSTISHHRIMPSSQSPRNNTTPATCRKKNMEKPEVVLFNTNSCWPCPVCFGQKRPRKSPWTSSAHFWR